MFDGNGVVKQLLTGLVIADRVKLGYRIGIMYVLIIISIRCVLALSSNLRIPIVVMEL